ncbi:MAG: hypothetical protein ACRC7N_04600 [Clostridium sp.]
MCSRRKQEVIIEETLNVTTEITDNVRKEQCQTILVALALKFGVEINNELGRKIRMSPLGQKIFNEGIEEGMEKLRYFLSEYFIINTRLAFLKFK